MRNLRLSGGGGMPLIPQKGGQLMWIASGGQAGLAGADDGEGFIGWKVGESFLERAG